MVHKKNGVAINFLYNMSYQVALFIVPLLVSPYLSRTLGVETLGQYTYAYSVAYCFYLVGLLGINNYGSRSIAYVRDNKILLDYKFSSIYCLQFIISSFTTLVYIITCYFVNHEHILLRIIFALFVASNIFNIDWFFFGIEEFKVASTRKTLLKFLTSLLIIAFVKSSNDILQYAIIVSSVEFLGNIYLWFYLPKYIDLKKVSLADSLVNLKPIVVLFVPIAASCVYRCMDKIMLGYLWGTDSVGQYDYAEKIIMIGLGCMAALGTVMLPKMSNLLINNDIKEYERYLNNSMTFAIIIASGLSFGLAASGTNFSVIYFGESFSECGYILERIGLTVFPIAWANVIRTQYLIPNNKDKEYVISVVLGAFVNFFINFILIPIYGVDGAICGTIIAEFLVATIQTYFVYGDLNILKLIKDNTGFVAAGIIMYSWLTLINTYIDNNLSCLILQIVSGVLIYAILVLLCLRYKKNELYFLLLNIFKRHTL